MMIWCSLESFTFSEEPCSYPGGNRYDPLAFACATSPVCSLAEIIYGGLSLVKTIFEDILPYIKDTNKGKLSLTFLVLCASSILSRKQ
jgi:hypothetical protein